MSVEVKLELGHKAVLRDEPTSEGFTHDWTVFVKGCEGSNIYHFVDKVVFHLHESFPKPKRVVKESPYQVSECGYAGFMMPIEVYFRSKEEPKKVRFEYDLYLRLEGEPVHNIRLEKLTFQNPSEDFRRKLLKARSVTERSLLTGGSTAIAGLPTLAVAPLQLTEDSCPTPIAHLKPTPAIAEKKQRTHSTSKEPSKPSPPTPTEKSTQPFNEILESPVKNKHSPESNTKSKEITHSNHQKPDKVLSVAVPPPPPPPAAAIARKEPKPIAKESHSNEKEKAKTVKNDKEPKTTTKRSHQNSEAVSHNVSEKKKKHSSSSSSDKSMDTPKVKEEKKDKHKTKSGLPIKKDKHKSGNLSQHKEPRSPKMNSSHKAPAIDAIHESDSNEARSGSFPADENNSDPPSSAPPDTPEESYNALSPIPRDGDDFNSTLSSESDSPTHTKEKHHSHSSESNHSLLNEPEVKFKPEVLKQKATLKPKVPGLKYSTDMNGNSRQNGSCKEEPPEPPELPRTIDPIYHQELIELQRRIMSLNDIHQLQKIVDVIEKTGKYHVTTTSFDFDLCSLDKNTVKMLRSCLTV